MVGAGIFFHLWGALRRAFLRIVVWFGLTGLITAILAELAGIFSTGQLPGLPTHLAALALGLAVGYAAGMTVLAGEIITSLITIVRDIGRDLERGMGEGGKLGGAVARGIEQFERRL
jgi:hypothetical protein